MGHVLSKKYEQGKMNPKESKINFAVPNERYQTEKWVK